MTTENIKKSIEGNSELSGYKVRYEYIRLRVRFKAPIIKLVN